MPPWAIARARHAPCHGVNGPGFPCPVLIQDFIRGGVKCGRSRASPDPHQPSRHVPVWHNATRKSGRRLTCRSPAAPWFWSGPAREPRSVLPDHGRRRSFWLNSSPPRSRPRRRGGGGAPSPTRRAPSTRRYQPRRPGSGAPFAGPCDADPCDGLNFGQVSTLGLSTCRPLYMPVLRSM